MLSVDHRSQLAPFQPLITIVHLIQATIKSTQTTSIHAQNYIVLDVVASRFGLVDRAHVRSTEQRRIDTYNQQEQHKVGIFIHDVMLRALPGVHDLAQASLPHRSCVVPSKPIRRQYQPNRPQNLAWTQGLPTHAAKFVSQTESALH